MIRTNNAGGFKSTNRMGTSGGGSAKTGMGNRPVAISMMVNPVTKKEFISWLEKYWEKKANQDSRYLIQQHICCLASAQATKMVEIQEAIS